MTVGTDNGQSGNVVNFELGISGFWFADLFDATRLKDLADTFYAEVESREPILHSALTLS